MILETKGVDWSANGKQIVQDINLHINAGEFVGLIGPNGSGKSTLLRTIYRILRPKRGEVVLNGRDVWQQSARAVAQQTAVVAQETQTEFSFTVQQIVAMGRNPHKGMFERDTAEDAAIIEAALERVDMMAFQSRDFRTLSGGEKQRVLIARALAQQTPFIILDEPTNHLDIRYQLEILELIQALSVTKLAALHDLNLAAAYCDRLYLLRDGQILASGPPQVVLTPHLIEDAYGVQAEVGRHPLTGQLHLAFAPHMKQKDGESQTK
ncbi:MAG: ABC transporter ATP-binding protein [Chloroflexota bacterium]